MFLFLSPLAFFGLPSFSVSLSLSLSFLLFFLYSFLSLFFAFFWFLVWVSFFILLSSLVFFHERNNIKIFNCKFCSSWNIFSFFSFLPFFVKRAKLFLIFALSWILNYVFCSTSRLFDFQTNNLQKKHVLVKRGVATKRFFFINLCFGKCQKLSFSFWPFFGNFWLMFKKHNKNRYFSTFLKAKNWKKWQFLIVTNWATLIVTNWATFVQLKNGQRGPVSNY